MSPMSDETKKLHRKEAAEVLDVHPNTLKSWEEKFNLVIPRFEHDKRNIRYYTDRELKILKYIKGCYDQGLNAKAIKDLLEENQMIEKQKNELIKETGYQNVDLETFLDMITDRNQKIIAKSVNSIKEDFRKSQEKTQSELESIRKENEELKKLLEENLRRQEEREKQSIWDKLFKSKP